MNLIPPPGVISVLITLDDRDSFIVGGKSGIFSFSKEGWEASINDSFIRCNSPLTLKGCLVHNYTEDSLDRALDALFEQIRRTIWTSTNTQK